MSTHGPPLVGRTGAGGRTQCQASVHDANTDVIGAGASVCREQALAAALQTPCRTAYGGRTLSNASLIQTFYI